MDKKQIELFKEIVKAEEKDFGFNDYVLNYVDDDDLKDLDIDDLEQYLRDLDEDSEITREDVIYDSNAIEYLKENDPSLNESLKIAKEYGYDDLEKINSELLASLLKSQNNQSDYNDFIESVIKAIEE